MSQFSPIGLGVALITPFDKEGNIDFGSLKNVVEHIIDGGADYIVVLGTTAETPTLSADERAKVLNFVKNVTKRRVPLVVGLSGNNTSEVSDLISGFDADGFDAILTAVPNYNKPSQEGIYQHFKYLAEVSPLPLILYNIPSRTGVNMLSSTTLRLAKEIPGIIGIKEASGVISQIAEIIFNKPTGFYVISGDDSLTLPLMALGADGVISVIANAYPREFKDLIQNALNNDFDKARFSHAKLSKILPLLFAEGNPSGVKCLLNKLGLIQNFLRLPLTTVSHELLSRIYEEADRISTI